MSEVSMGAGWWQASDGKWYAPEVHPDLTSRLPPPPAISPPSGPAPLPQPLATPGPALVPGHTPPGSLAQQPPGLITQDQAPNVYGVPVSPLSPDVTQGGSGKQSLLRRIPPVVPWIIAAVFFISTVALGIVSVQQTSSANKWRDAAQSADKELAAAHSAIKLLENQVSGLNGQVSSLNTQLSAQATAKEKALDQNTVLGQAVSAEESVSGELNNCVSDLQQFLSTVATDLDNGFYNDPTLTEESTTANRTCTQAQTDNRAVQSALSGGGG